jgi:hypothetical protein
MEKSILIDGMSEEELLELVKEKEYQEIIFMDEPIIFKAGTSEILGQFNKDATSMEIILSQIEGGGEGVLLKITNLFREFAKSQAIQEIDWIIHAADCPKPNPKLKRVLELKGFKMETHERDGLVYRKIERISDLKL